VNESHVAYWPAALFSRDHRPTEADWQQEEILCRRGGGTVSVLTPPPKA
jgi:hypothetical protein